MATISNGLGPLARQREGNCERPGIPNSSPREECSSLRCKKQPCSCLLYTSLYRGLTDGGFAADLEALGNTADFAPGVLVARYLGGLDFMLGAVMTTTKKHLTEIGGFESLADYFCDDYELGNRIASRLSLIHISKPRNFSLTTTPSTSARIAC